MFEIAKINILGRDNDLTVFLSITKPPGLHSPSKKTKLKIDQIHNRPISACLVGGGGGGQWGISWNFKPDTL